MNSEVKKIVRFDVWYHPVMAQTLEAPANVVFREARLRMGLWAAEQILQVLRGEEGPRMVNPQVFAAYRQRLQASNHLSA